MITISGTVGSSGTYLVTSIPVNSAVPVLLKLTFENITPGTNLSLVAGTVEDFENGTGMNISDSGGPGLRFLSILDTGQLDGRHLFVRREVGTADSDFTLSID